MARQNASVFSAMQEASFKTFIERDRYSAIFTPRQNAT